MLLRVYNFNAVEMARLADIVYVSVQIIVFSKKWSFSGFWDSVYM